MNQTTIYLGIIDNYIDCQKLVVKMIIDNKKTSIMELSKTLGISRNTFYRRMENSDFKPKELKKIINILY